MTSSNHISGTDRVYEAVSKIGLKDNDVIINLQGDEPFINPKDINNLFDLASELDIIDKVDFLGYVENEKELLNLLRSYDVFVLSSVTEGFPRVLYESMTSSLPIVTTNVGGIPYLLDDKHNAIIVKKLLDENIVSVLVTSEFESTVTVTSPNDHRNGKSKNRC